MRWIQSILQRPNCRANAGNTGDIGVLLLPAVLSFTRPDPNMFATLIEFPLSGLRTPPRSGRCCGLVLFPPSLSDPFTFIRSS